MPHPIPLLRVSGTHREVGRQIGEACAEDLRTWASDFDEIPSGRTREQQLDLAREYWDVTARYMPWLIEEFEGAAEAADIDPIALFAVDVEEIWYEPRAPAGARSVRAIRGRCSDLVAVPPATANGHALVAHNNDLSPRSEDTLMAIEWKVPGEPAVFTIGGGLGASVGFNEEGIAFTGNELSPNDERVGIPRGPQFRAMLRERAMDDVLAVALHPSRASSYNNVLTAGDGRVVNVEGSATDAELTGPDDSGHLAHTNHYVCDRMLPLEGDPEYAVRSDVRYRRALEMLAAAEPGTVTEESLREMLSDHEGAPDSLCRHPKAGDAGSKTVFWIVADVTEDRVTFGRGNPCNSQAQEYAFA